MDAIELSMVPDLILPPKFKVPNFKKYDGTTCLFAHLTIFCRRMTGYTENEKLLIHCFQDNLTGLAAKWQYAQRWHDVASQVQPPLLEKEDTFISVNTLKALYLGHLLGNATKNFADLVISGELIENSIGMTRLKEEKDRRSPILKRRKVRYHAGIAGHDIMNCLTFKKVKQNLINIGDLEFKTPSTNAHALPYHGRQGVNMIDEREIRITKRDVSEVKSPLSWVFIQLCTSGMIRGDDEQRGGRILQLRGEPTRDERNESSSSITPKVVITTLSTFPFKDTRQVSWSYTTSVSIPEGPKTPEKVSEKNKSILEEVSEVGHFTRSRRWYFPETSTETDKTKAKAKMVVVPKIFNEEPSLIINEPMNEAHGREFLRFLKHSEYNTFFPEDILTHKLDQIVGYIVTDNYITFTDDEIPEGGMRSIKALNITVHCHNHVLPVVLIDNRSALNVMPLATLQRIPIDSLHMRVYHNIIRTFNRTQKNVMGKMKIPLLIGPTIYYIDFVIMNIHPTYNFLLGRPWIHVAGAIPSSLYQKLKFLINGRLVSIGVEQEIIASVTSDTPYIDVNEDTLECSFRALEFINTEGNKILRPSLSDCTKMMRSVRHRTTTNQCHRDREADKGRGVDGRSSEGAINQHDYRGNQLGKFIAGIHPCFPGEKLENWTAEDFPLIFRVSPK
ncbi:uncharacterized protein LOC120138584 [Hibiscus syriacus]|uniref:uncharacterized protein LOC120138584 n=1 Tax=Hibiscus syriacus TaxID=106335 RepID=UPI001920F9FB|nr:uncharacterized protein LOC120138584 [Hibiscus syriacus]